MRLTQQITCTVYILYIYITALQWATPTIQNCSLALQDGSRFCIYYSQGAYPLLEKRLEARGARPSGGNWVSTSFRPVSNFRIHRYSNSVSTGIHRHPILLSALLALSINGRASRTYTIWGTYPPFILFIHWSWSSWSSKECLWDSW